MLEQYKKTFGVMQITMWGVAAIVAKKTGHLSVGLVFLATMQVGALLGAVWGARMRGGFSRRA